MNEARSTREKKTCRMTSIFKRQVCQSISVFFLSIIIHTVSYYKLFIFHLILVVVVMKMEILEEHVRTYCERGIN